jgi:hypothetical protein
MLDDPLVDAIIARVADLVLRFPLSAPTRSVY